VVQVAKALGTKVFVERDKWNVLQCLDLPATEKALLTRNINEAGIHVLPMAHVRLNHAACLPLCLCSTRRHKTNDL
jgi:hypothetical protein